MNPPPPKQIPATLEQILILWYDRALRRLRWPDGSGFVLTPDQAEAVAEYLAVDLAPRLDAARRVECVRGIECLKQGMAQYDYDMDAFIEDPASFIAALRDGSEGMMADKGFPSPKDLKELRNGLDLSPDSLRISVAELAAALRIWSHGPTAGIPNRLLKHHEIDEMAVNLLAEIQQQREAALGSEDG